MDEGNQVCGNRVLCICKNTGCECSLTDNEVDPMQPGCMDHIEDENGPYE